MVTDVPSSKVHVRVHVYLPWYSSMDDEECLGLPTTKRPRWTPTYGDHALVCSKGRGGQMGCAWKRARHDGARNNILVLRLGKGGRRQGSALLTCSPVIILPAPATISG